MSNDRTPPAEGTIILDAAFDLPQGKAQVLNRLALEGIDYGRAPEFTNPAVQEKIDEPPAGPGTSWRPVD